MSELLKLAKRCEKATGPDRELDAMIAETIGEKHGRETGWCNSENDDYYVIDECAALYTASLDAAMTLVPEGWGQFDVDATAPELGIDWTLHGPERREAKGTAAAPALALCAAALRARASGETE
jgi:hypothetical protein